jgi:NADH dehydrogenase
MTTANNRFVTVFGGTGFLGRRVVRHLRKHGFSVRIASRHPDRGQRLFALDDPQLQSIEANIHDERSVASAVVGTYAVVKLPGFKELGITPVAVEEVLQEILWDH